MIGDLVHYNCGGSKAIGVITDWFRYEPRANASGDRAQCIYVSVEWIKKSRPMPQALGPRHYSPHERDEEIGKWPEYWRTKPWYMLSTFKVISRGPA